jgi:hypothetical protein
MLDGFVDSPILPHRYMVNENGSVYSKFRKKIISQRLDKDGYVRVNLYENSKNTTILVHRLVALAFIPNVDDTKKEVNHKDGVKTNNHISNLEWVTSSENQIHAFKIGLQKGQIGESNGYSKYKESDVVKVCAMLILGEPNKNIIKQTGYSRSFVEKIKYGECWTHITWQYGITPKAKRITTS